jgi:hypothetical protein
VCVCDPAQVGADDLKRLEISLLQFKNSMELGEDSTHTVANKSFFASGYDPRHGFSFFGSLGARAVDTFWNQRGLKG